MFLPLDPPAGLGLSFTDRHGGVSTGSWGSLNLGRTDVDDIAAVAENFDRVQRAASYRRIVTAHQVHGADVLIVDDDFLAGWGARHHLGPPAGGPALPVADALVTTVPDVALCIRVADCVPVLLADPAAGVVGAAHAGRAGFLAGVLPATVAAMRAHGAGRLSAWIGPHICGGCYEVPEAMRAAASAVHPACWAETTWGTPALDLGRACAEQLAGLGCDTIAVGDCTRTTDALHSHRREGAGAGRQAGLVWLTD